MSEQLYPIGYRVVVDLDEVEEVSEGGIVLTATTTNEEQSAGDKATVVRLGDKSFEDDPDGRHVVKKGARVLIRKRAYCHIHKDDNVRVVINDKDVIGVLVND